MRDEKFYRQELCVRAVFRIFCAFIFILRIIGLSANFNFYADYMAYKTEYNNSDFRDVFEIYSGSIVVIAFLELLFILLLGTRLLFLMYKHHRDEYKENKLWMILFGTFIFIE